MNNRGTGRYYSPVGWKHFYEQTFYSHDEILSSGKLVTVHNRRSNIQKIIVKMITNSILSYNIKVLPEGQDSSNIFKNNSLKVNGNKINIYNLVLSPLAYGECLVDIIEGVPKIIINYSKKYDFKGELIYVQYRTKLNNKKEEIITHFKRGDFYYVQTGDTKVEMYSGERLRCFIIESNNKVGEYADPIYADAINSIREFDDSYNEMPIDRNLSRKMVLLPKQMLSKRDEALLEGKTITRSDKDERLFQQWDTESDSHQQPIYLNGKFAATEYIKEMNVHLDLIGMNSGVGQNVLSFDKDGNIRTAEEVRYNDKMAMVTDANVKGMFEDIMYELLTRLDVDCSKLVVVFSTSEKEELSERDGRLLQEYMSGLIDKETYHKERGRTDEEIKELVPDNIPDMVEPLG